MTLKHSAYYHCFDPDPARGQPKVIEGETKNCVHCGVARFIPRAGYEAVGGLCGHCWGFLCENCAAIGSCDPLEEKFRRYERWAREMDRRTGVSPPFNPYRLLD